MPQLSWSITGHNGSVYRLGLFHGEEDGHVVVHCNDRVVAIDFNVTDSSKTYSVFLDQELCEVSIDHTGGRDFEYDCRINREAATPLNARRNKLKADEARADQYRLMGLLGVGIVFLLWWLLR